MKPQTVLLSLVLCAAFFTGCKSVKSILNSNKVSSADEQKRALATNSSSLTQLKTCDFNLNIGAKDFDNILIPTFNELINQKQIPHVKQYSISNINALTDKEQITISPDFQVTLDTLNASIKGQLIGTISFAFKNDSMILYPAFKYIHVDDITYKKTGKITRKAVAFIINTIFNIFIERLNGYMISKIPAIPLNLVDRQVASGELVNSATEIVTLSRPLLISTPISSTACLIDKDGIHILGAFSTPATLPDSTARYNFNTFQKGFSGKRDSAFAGLPHDTTTYMILSKNAFSTIFNNTFNNENITITNGSDNFLSGRSDKNITLDLSEINCGDVNPPCPPLVNCGNAPNCDGSHGLGKIACLATLPVRYAAWLACQGVYHAAQVACAAEKVTAEGACVVAKAALQVTTGGKISIGDIHATVSSTATASGTVSGVSFSNDLSGISLSTQATVNAPLQTTFGFTPEGPVGHLVCVLGFNHPYNCNASSTIPPTNMAAAISFDDSTKNVLFIKFKTTPLDIKININPTPLTLMNRDVTTLINCPLLSIGVGLGDIVKGFHDVFTGGDFQNNIQNAILNGTYTYSLKSYDFSLPIKTVQVKLLDNQIALSPANGSSYIGFYKN